MKALAAALLLFAIQPIDIDTTKLENGRHYAYAADDRQVTVDKASDITTIHVVDGQRVDTLIVRQVEGKTVIAHSDNGIGRPARVNERTPIVVDGINVEPYLTDDDRGSRDLGPASYFICPKDRAMLRVPNAPRDAMYKCPVDGTLMRPGVGPTKEFYLLH